MSIKTKTVLKTALVAFVLTSVAACSDKPKPVDPVPQPPVATAPETTPAPTPAPTQPVTTGILPGSQQDFVVNVGDRVYFDTDQSSLRADAQGVLAAQAAWLNRYPGVKIRIEGSADERGTREYNFALGARRAEAVSEFLVSKGVAPARISTISYGKENPLNPGSDEDAWAQNRNAHTSLTSGVK
jgi:peptidoglycan-associated lipoprotein